MTNFTVQQYINLFCVLIILFTDTNPATACTRLLQVDSHHATMVGRNMDWKEDPRTNLVVYPRGQSRSGDVDLNEIKWVSRYGSIVATAYEGLGSDGLNERGLAAHLLWQNAADYGSRDSSLPGLSIKMWIQYYLDNFKTVKEAVQFSRKESFQLVPFFHPEAKKWVSVHLILDDASGDSAILEYIDGQLQIYHDKDYVVAANDPTFDQQLLNLKNYKAFGGELPLPGTNRSLDRFVRASYYAQHVPRASSIQDEVAQVLSILNNTAQPYSTVTSENPFDAKTYWHTVADLTNRVYYFQSTVTQNLIKVRLEHFDLNAGNSIKQLDMVNHPELAGDMSDHFETIS
jgi:choloylglycine hydrolase